MAFANPFSTKTGGSTTVTAAEINAAGVSIERAVDGTGGSNGVPYAPSTKIEISGSGLEFAGGAWPLLSSRDIVRRQNLIIARPYVNLTGSFNQPFVTEYGANKQQAAVIQNTYDSGNPRSMLYLDLIQGAKLKSLAVTTIGVGEGDPENVPTYYIVGVALDGAKSLVSSALDAHTYGGSTNYLTDRITTTITPLTPHTVNRETSVYGLDILHPYEAHLTVGYGMIILDIAVTYTVTSMQL